MSFDVLLRRLPFAEAMVWIQWREGAGSRVKVLH